jgi:tetratricopeptide (TPR) repeat protein
MSLPSVTLVVLMLTAGSAPLPHLAEAEAEAEAEVEVEVDPKTRAQAEFADGERAWAREDYAAAAEHFETAQRLMPHPYTQYNLGLAQHRAGDNEAAWATFEDLIARADDTRQRDDAIRAQARVRAQLSFVEVRAPPHVRVCFDGRPLDPSHREMTRPGAHDLTVDGRPLPLTLEPGETRVLEVGPVDSDATRRRRATIGLGVTAATSAAAAAGLATGAVLTDDGTSTSMTIGAAVAGGVALGSVIALLAVQPRRDGTPTRRRASASTPAPCR